MMDGGGDEKYDRQIERRIEALEGDVKSLVAWRNWVIGAVGGIGIMVGAYAKQVASAVRQALGG